MEKNGFALYIHFNYLSNWCIDNSYVQDNQIQ